MKNTLSWPFKLLWLQFILHPLQFILHLMQVILQTKRGIVHPMHCDRLKLYEKRHKEEELAKEETYWKNFFNHRARLFVSLIIIQR